MSEDTDTTDEAPKPLSPLQRYRKWWLGLKAWQSVSIVLVVLAVAVGILMVIQNPNDAGGATDACRERVQQRLKSPSTAEFGDSSARELGSTGDRWEVVGVVDAQNGFGATVRISYKCDLTYNDAMDSWSAALVDVRE